MDDLSKWRSFYLPEGWEVKRISPKRGIPAGFLINSPRVAGVSQGTGVFLDDDHPAHRLLALMLEEEFQRSTALFNTSDGEPQCRGAELMA